MSAAKSSFVGNWGNEWAVMYDGDKQEYIILPYLKGYEPFTTSRLDEIGAEIAKRKEQKNGKEANRDAD